MIDYSNRNKLSDASNRLKYSNTGTASKMDPCVESFFCATVHGSND